MVTAGPRTRRRDEEERIILMKSRDRRAERMSEFVTNMFQYNVTVGITRSEVYNFIFFLLTYCFPKQTNVKCAVQTIKSHQISRTSSHWHFAKFCCNISSKKRSACILIGAYSFPHLRASSLLIALWAVYWCS